MVGVMDEAPAPSPAGDPAAFVAKWRGAWPEWQLVERFVPADMRARAEAWEALQFEWQEAAWGGADARPGEAKLLWWAEELTGWSRGLRRHPLGALLQREAAPWSEIARVLPSLADRNPPADAMSAWSSLAPLAAVLAAADVALLGGRREPRGPAAAWLHARLARHSGSAVPVACGPADAASWRHALVVDWPASRGLAPSRAVLLALARARMARGDASTPLPPLAAVWAGWRGARG